MCHSTVETEREGTGTAPGSSRDVVLQVTVIRARRGLVSLNLKEIWEYRELCYFLVWRDLKVRFRQTAFGAGWAVLQPLILTAIFTIFLNRVAGIHSQDLPYAVFALAGVVPWTLFSRALITSSASLVDNQNMIGKVYFPRLLLPMASASSYVLDFLVSVVVLAVVLAVYGIIPTIAVVLAPLFAVWALTAALAFGIFLSAVNVRYRDVGFLMPFLVQLWLLATPIAYPLAEIPSRWQTVLGLNPVAGVVTGFRWAVTGTFPPSSGLIVLSLITTVLMLVVGLVYFRHTERTFADVI